MSGTERRLDMLGSTERPALLPTPATAAVSTSPLRVLVVEDNPDAAASLQMLLEMLGHEVQVARTGIEGVEMALDWEPDVVLCDIGLPGLDGFGVAEELRPTGVRLIAITGYGSEEFRRRAYASGFAEVLIKPADPNMVVRLLGGAS
jgi:CheY-like chemotaxis protein